MADAGLTPIAGTARATAEQMAAYLVKRTPDAASYALAHARLYFSEGKGKGSAAMWHGHSGALKPDMIPMKGLP